MSVQARSFVILQRILEMKDAGNTQEELVDYLVELKRKKILTTDVVRGILLYSKLGITAPEQLNK